MAKPRQRESVIERTVVRYARSLGVIVYKFQSPAQRGVPDRVCIYRGLVWFIEFKATGARPTVQQQHHINMILEQGVKVLVIDNIEDGCTLIDAMITVADTRAERTPDA